MNKYLLPIIFLFSNFLLQGQSLKTDGDIESKQINTSGFEVGYVAGSASVSLSGNATYGIPIYIPDGIRGMQPSVSVSYSSGGGNGLLGYGWNLNAYSAISYDSKNIYNDNEVAPNYVSGGSPFLLDGSRLIPISATEFRTESESFSKITASSATKPASFTVITKSGITMEYGILGSITDAILTNSAAVPVKWYLKKTSDNLGNYVEYLYAIVNNETVLKTITYTKSTAVTIAAPNVISFEYDTRVDNTVFFSMQADATTVEPMYRKNKLKYIEVKAEGQSVKKV